MNPIKPNTLFCLLISSLLAVSSFGQKEGALDDLSTKAADLEAQVRKLDASTVEGANVLLELSDLYHENGRAFGMIRTGKTFVKTHKGHPRHKELMLKLLDAYLVTSRNDDIVSTSRQFLEFYGKDAAAPRVARELAVLLNRLGKRDETAKAYEHAWKLAGVKDLNSAFEAVRLYGGNRGAQFARECGRLSEEILDKLPNGSTARELGWYGYNQARYGNWDLKRSVAIGNKLLQRNLITDPKQRGQLHYYLALDLWQQGQRTNANQHFQKAWETQRDNSSYLEQLINYLGSSSAKAGQILPHVNEYRRRFPENKVQLGTSLSILAHAYARDKQPAQAVTVAAEALALNPTHNQVAYYYVTWINALDPKRLPEAENVLRQAIPKVKPEHRYAVRYPLAIHLLRDKVKDPNRARGEAFQLLAEDSTGHSWVSTTLNWFLDSATDQASFQRDAERVVKVAEANGNRSYLRSWLSTWSKAAGSTDDAKANKKWLRNRLKAMNANPEIVSWAAFDKADSNNKPKQFPDLANKLNSEEKFVRFHSALGYDYLHYASAKGKPNSISHYKALAKRFPKDSSHAARWLGSAGNGTAADRLEAVRHFLQADSANSYGDWYNAFRAAHENKDDNLLRQVLQYVNKAEDKFGKSLGNVTNNANYLLDRNMTAEAKQYLDRHMDIDPNHGGSLWTHARNIVLLSLTKADENAKINLLEARRKQDNDLHGAYASDLADILFKKKDWKRFAAVLRDARQRQDQRPFRTFSINTSLAGSWASSIRGDKEMEEATKVDLLKTIRDLRAWNYSISAALALLELETGKPKTEMERLRAMRDAILTADNSTHGWNLGLSFAQSALSNDDYVGAATLITAIQANASNVPDDYLANGRRLLSQAYSRITGIGLTIDKDSPLAPLMEAVLHLRLGDNELALETYLANKGLFDSHREEVPFELILFACENHIAAGGDQNHERTEDVLRGWLVKNTESKNFEVAEKAAIQLLLGRNYFKWSRFDVARSEFMTVKNSYPDTDQAIEAEFGIGETFMAQKNYEKSEEVFEGLSNSRDTRVAIRADFMRGVLAARRDDRDEARNIFRSVLERVPNIRLANETLFNLAEVYGVEQRYMDQLDLLRAVGRLGQESKRWHEPGVALSIVVQDSDLGISRGHTRIPVSITSLPSGDKETVYLISGGAGKGLFMAEIPTTLGQVTPDDRVLQLKGSDVITVDYPEDFKKDFRFHMMSTNKIHIAANAEFDAASSIVAKNEEEEKTFTEELIDEQDEEEKEGVAEGRPANQIKPGNFIYLRVSDKDRDLTDETDQTLVKLDATSGDAVTVQLNETGPNTGIFIGRAKTDELPAGALASDVSIDSNPLMAIDKDEDSSWVSEPDGIAPKWLTVDTKDIHGVTNITLRSPNQPGISDQWVYRDAAGQDRTLLLDEKGSYEVKSGENSLEKGSWKHEASKDILTLSPVEGNVTSFDWDYVKGRFISGDKENPHVRDGTLSPGNQTPVRIRMRGSHDGRFWYELARFPAPVPATDPGLAKDGEGITQRVYKVPTNALSNWEDYFVKWIADNKPEEQEQVETLEWEIDPDLVETDPKAAKHPRLIVWSGKLAQHKAGAVRFLVTADRSAIYLDGKLVLEPDSTDTTRSTAEVDVFLQPGAHELTIAAYVAKPDTSGAVATRARENPNSPAVTVGAFTASDFDVEGVPAPRKKEGEVENTSVQASQRGSSWNFNIPQANIRYMEFLFDEFIGQSLAINQVEILAGDKLLVPTQADVLAMSKNDILEITAGDVVTASYVDEFARGGRKNRLLTADLSVTYFNAVIRPIAYDFTRSGGNIQETIKDLMRVDPGERIVIEVTDYDMDSTAEVDKIPVEVILNNDDPIKLEASETKEHSGIFRTQIDTSANQEEGKLMVKAGDRVNLRYIDPQNTFPGHSFPRESFVFVRKPSEATTRIIETRFVRSPEEGSKSVFLPATEEPKEMAAFAYELPLTVEVIDPDMAKDSMSSIQVKILVGDENASREVDVKCEISSALGERTTAPIDFPNWALYEGRFIGQVQLQLGGPDSPTRIPAGVDGPMSVIGGVIPPPGEAEEDGLDLTVRVLNLTGADVATAAYEDIDRPEGNATVLESRGRMISDGSLALTGPDYGELVELLYVGEKLYVRVIDPDHDVSDERDMVVVNINTRLGEKEKISLEETFSHSGAFTGSFRLDALEKPVPGNLGNNATAIETFFGDLLSATYVDEISNVEEGALESTAELAVSIGANGIISSFSKVFGDEDLAVRTQFHIAESYFELFKSHQKLGRDKEAANDLEHGRRTLKHLVEDYPDPKYAPRVNYLLGQFSQELKQWSDAIDAYETIVRNYPEDTLAADAQYKLAQAYEEAERFDDALEAYVTLASTYPNSPLIANVMIRINEYFYRGENYLIAAKVGGKFVERFEAHQWAPKMAFRIGQCHYKALVYKDAADAFDDFVKRYPDDKLCSEALFWGGESYRMGSNVPLAFQRYNRCRWDFPESDAAKYARGRLALPEMLRQFEAAANLDQ